MIGQKRKITALLIFLPENFKKVRSTELYNAPPDGSTIFLYRSFSSGSPLDSSVLAELEYAFFSRTEGNTKKIMALEPFSIDYL